MLGGQRFFSNHGMGGRRMLFLPMCLFLRFCKQLRSSSGVLLTIIAPYWPQRPWFPDLLELVVDDPVALPRDRVLLSQPHVHRQHLVCQGWFFMPGDYPAIIRSSGFSWHVAKQAALVRQPSSSAGYQAKWPIYWRWCTSEGHSIYRPSLSN